MPWSLGVVPDLLWNVFPCLREKMRDLLVRHINSAILARESPWVDYRDESPSDDQLVLPESHEYVMHIMRPMILNSVAEGRATVETTSRLCRYLRLLLTFDGQHASLVRRYGQEIIEDIGTLQGIAAVSSLDPELVGYIRGQLGMWASQ
jgi:hypothetical protein